jgi:hypothetical protein
MTEYSLTNGLPIPDDFPIENYEKIHSLVFLKSNTHRNEYFFFLLRERGFYIVF